MNANCISLCVINQRYFYLLKKPSYMCSSYFQYIPRFGHSVSSFSITFLPFQFSVFQTSVSPFLYITCYSHIRTMLSSMYLTTAATYNQLPTTYRYSTTVIPFYPFPHFTSKFSRIAYAGFVYLIYQIYESRHYTYAYTMYRRVQGLQVGKPCTYGRIFHKYKYIRIFCLYTLIN